MEDIIRQAIKEFDYPECTIFKQLVQTIAPVEKVSDLELVVFFLAEMDRKKRRDGISGLVVFWEYWIN